MAYSPTYSTSDFSAMVVDLLGTGLFQVINFVAIIVLIAIVLYLMNQLKKTGVKLK